jgi:xylulokinase
VSRGRYVLGHDVGTSGDKVVLCDLEGRTLATAHEPYPLRQARAGWAEQDGEELVAAVGRASQRVITEHGASADDVVAVGLSGQMFSAIAVDRTGHSVSPLISWLDTRSTPQAAEIAGGEPDAQYSRYGSVFTAKDIVPKILWLRDEAPDVWRKAACFLDCKDFVGARLTGEIATDHAGASAYLIYDVTRRTWDRSAITELGIALERLPQVLDATEVLGALTMEAAAATGLRPGTPVVVGAGDVPAGQLGAGSALHGETHVSLGTASYFGISLDRVLTDPGRRLGLLCHADPRRWLLWAEMETGGGALAWWRRTLGLANPEDADRLADEVDPSQTDLLFAPWLTGERVPYWDHDARGAFIGLSLSHGAGHMTRAVMEGIAFQMRLVLEYAEAFGVHADGIRVVGGAGMGRVLPAILADVLGRSLAVVADPQSAGARGAAFCALAACQGASLDALARSVEEARLIKPERGPEPYEARYRQFCQLHEALAQMPR